MSKSIKRVTTSSTNHKQVEHELRQKVASLEAQVKSLKDKLDELRKAKNTTIYKKEKEFVTTTVPQRQPETCTSKTEGSSSAKYQAKIDELTKELQDLKVLSKNEAPSDCSHEEIITALQTRLSDVESMNTALVIQNEQLQDRLSQAYSEISAKEAEHCQVLEQTKTELQRKWQEMYREWMRTTEVKIKELQATNDLLRQMLDQAKPSHLDKSL